MTVYERLDDAGTVVERVAPLEGSFEDTRLGVAALECSGGWRAADSSPAAERPKRGGSRGAQPNR